MHRVPMTVEVTGPSGKRVINADDLELYRKKGYRLVGEEPPPEEPEEVEEEELDEDEEDGEDEE